MIKSQFEKVIALAKQQFKEITKDTEKHRELERLANDQFFELEHDNRILPHYYQMPESNRSNWVNIATKDRAIYILCKSKAFTYKEIGELFGFNEQAVRRKFKIIKKYILSQA